MSILERRLAELGRIRVGDQVPLAGKKGGEQKTRPRRLETFRLTSQNKPRLEVAARLWGGAVQPWEDGPQAKLWQLYTEADALPVTVAPFNALTQTNEIWQGGECRLRCDGEIIRHSTRPEKINTPCFCDRMPTAERLEKAKEGLACHTITRLSLVLPDIPGIGIWRFETGSYYAGMELQGAAALLEQASAEGAFIECTLQIEERRVKRRNAQGDVQTQVFSVVTLQPDVTMRQLMTRQIPAAALVGQVPQVALPPPVTPMEEVWPETPRPHDVWNHPVQGAETITLPSEEAPRLDLARLIARLLALPDEGWRHAMTVLLPRLAEGYITRIQAELESAKTTSGRGVMLVEQAQAELDFVAQEAPTPEEA